jgi:UDP-N-acetylglucosamine 2-epimerase (non-hydrolysing)
MAMPEEVNRRATDAISDWFFVTEPSGLQHLRREGKPMEQVFDVGNVMVDNLLHQARRLADADTSAFETDAIKRRHRGYGVVTLHRPSNVDEARSLRRVGEALKRLANDLPLVFPVHPRTRQRMHAFGVDLGPNVELLPPQGYMPFLHLWKDAALVLTDSGGLQDETTALGVPCVTIRENTERPITVEEGTNVLAGTDPEAVVAAARLQLNGGSKKGRRPKLWDGRAAERIVSILARELAK